MGVEYDTGEEFDSSWNRGDPSSSPARTDSGLAGRDPGHEGRRWRKLVIPPHQAYGPAGSGHRLSGKTLIFVIDRLGTRFRSRKAVAEPRDRAITIFLVIFYKPPTFIRCGHTLDLFLNGRSQSLRRVTLRFAEICPPTKSFIECIFHRKPPGLGLARLTAASSHCCWEPLATPPGTSPRRRSTAPTVDATATLTAPMGWTCMLMFRVVPSIPSISPGVVQLLDP